MNTNSVSGLCKSSSYCSSCVRSSMSNFPSYHYSPMFFVYPFLCYSFVCWFVRVLPIPTFSLFCMTVLGWPCKTETDKVKHKYSGHIQEILLLQYKAMLPQDLKLHSRRWLCVLAFGREWCSHLCLVSFCVPVSLCAFDLRVCVLES